MYRRKAAFMSPILSFCNDISSICDSDTPVSDTAVHSPIVLLYIVNNNSNSKKDYDLLTNNFIIKSIPDYPGKDYSVCGLAMADHSEVQNTKKLINNYSMNRIKC